MPAMSVSPQLVALTALLTGFTASLAVHLPSEAAQPQPADATWTQQTAWRLSDRPILQINGSEDKVEQAPLDPVSVFRLADGRYVIADGDQNGWHALLVYNAQGRFVGKWGRSGMGPGEFRQLFGWAGSYRGDSVAAYDFDDRALEIFTSTGKSVRQLKMPITHPPVTRGRNTPSAGSVFIGAFADGSVLRYEPTGLAAPPAPGPSYLQPELMIYDVNGANPQRLGRFRTWGYWWDGQEDQEYLYQPVSITVAGKDVWYQGNGEDFIVRVMDKQGREVRALKRPFTPERISAADRNNHIEWRIDRSRGQRKEATEQRLRTKAKFAENKPPYSNLVEDELGNVWIEHFRDPANNTRPARWSVFDKDGRFLGDVQVPAATAVCSITRDQVITIFTDEFDVEHVRIYSLIKP